MKENKFKIGDIVILNSGGPDMTIIHIYDDKIIQCCWNNGMEFSSAEFPEECVLIKK